MKTRRKRSQPLRSEGWKRAAKVMVKRSRSQLRHRVQWASPMMPVQQMPRAEGQQRWQRRTPRPAARTRVCVSTRLMRRRSATKCGATMAQPRTRRRMEVCFATPRSRAPRSQCRGRNHVLKVVCSRHTTSTECTVCSGERSARRICTWKTRTPSSFSKAAATFAACCPY